MPDASLPDTGGPAPASGYGLLPWENRWDRRRTNPSGHVRIPKEIWWPARSRNDARARGDGFRQNHRRSEQFPALTEEATIRRTTSPRMQAQPQRIVNRALIRKGAPLARIAPALASELGLRPTSR